MNDQQIREEIKNYFAIDKEIKDSDKVLSEFRKKRKAAGANILQWMQENKKTRIKTKHGVLERSVQSRKVTVNAARVQECISSEVHDENLAARLTKIIYDQRPSQEKEVLKTLKSDPTAPPPEQTVNL